MPNSFVFDPNRCTGCQACRVACGIENGLPPEQSWRRVETFNDRHHPGVPLFHLSLACNHCAEPACMYACPAFAYYRDQISGAVLLDESKCIGCKYCSWACPFDAPVFDARRGVMSKCTFCNHRLELGLKPACASLCPTRALDFADLPEVDLVNDLDGFPVTELGPRIHIAPLKPERRLPVVSEIGRNGTHRSRRRPVSPKISLRSEWSLMLFTSFAAILVAWLTSAVAGAVALPVLPYLGGAALTMGLGSLHLGRPSRSYRAVLNIRRSWLSREVLTLSAFFATAVAYAWLAPDSLVLGAVASLLGFSALYCGDQVYSVLERSGPGYKHSASVLWAAFYLTSILVGSGWLAGAFGFGKFTLYVIRKLRFIELRRSVLPEVSALRVGMGFVLPLALWMLQPLDWRYYVFAVVVIGELVDRAEYYGELESTTPRVLMSEALERQVSELTGRRRSHAPAATD